MLLCPRRRQASEPVTNLPAQHLFGVAVALVLASLPGCYFSRSPSRPLPALEFRREAAVRQHCLVVFLPGFIDGPETYLENRFPHALNGSGAPCDSVGVDLHFRYYSDIGLADIVYADILIPAAA